MELIDRFFQPARGSYFLFGPRGTGKSTWLRCTYPDALWVDLLDPAQFRAFSARPERLLDLVRGSRRKGTVVIDEVQKVPALLPAVHSLIEEQKGLRFVLTGSSARKLRRGAENLLGGRAALRTMHPFMAAELRGRFDFQRAIAQGLLPLVWCSDEPDQVLRSYAALYLREEVQAEGVVRHVGQFGRFLEAVSFSHASQLNVADVARECEVERKTVEGYVGVLEDLLLGYRLPVFRKRERRATVKHPKLYLFDAGAFRALRPAGPLDRPEEIGGGALEGLVAQHLCAWLDYGWPRNRLFFWRTRGGAEVDFVVYGPDLFWAVEVTSSRSVRRSELRGLAAFRKDYPRSRTLLLYCGKERLLQEGILCMSCETFLRSLRPDRTLEQAVEEQSWPEGSA